MKEDKLTGFDEVGCRRCGKGNNWKIYTNGKGEFRAVHKCGHISEFVIIENRDDVISIPMKLLV